MSEFEKIFETKESGFAPNVDETLCEPNPIYQWTSKGYQEVKTPNPSKINKKTLAKRRAKNKAARKERKRQRKY